MSTKLRYFIVIASVMLLCIGLVCWLYVDGEQLPLPEGDPLTGNATRLDIGFNTEAATATHDSESSELTRAQIDSLLELLRSSSYQRTLHGNSVSSDGDIAYAIGLVYRQEGRNETVLFSILGNMINICVSPDTSTGYLKIIDPEFLSQLQAILEN